MKTIKSHFGAKKNQPTLCHFCCRFMSHKEMSAHSVSWTQFGGYDDEEPPDPKWAHVRCWNKLSDKMKASITNGSWIKPSMRIDENQDYVDDLHQMEKQKELQ